jgi:hypothetical protein
MRYVDANTENFGSIIVGVILLHQRQITFSLFSQFLDQANNPTIPSK